MSIFKSTNVFKSPNILKTIWKPSKIEGLVFWSDSSEKNIITKNSKVLKWVDKSGNLNNALQDTIINQPLFQKNVIGEHHALYFDLIHNIQIQLSLDYFTVISVVNATNNDTLYEFGQDVSTETGFKLDGESTSSINTTKFGSISTRRNTDNPTWLSEGSTYKIINHQYNGSHISHLLYVNNSYISTTTYDGDNPGSLNTTNKLLTFGSEPSNSNGISGHVFELLIFNKSLSAAERNQVAEYLNSKYSIY